MDQILCLKNLIEKSLERNRKLYVGYMNLEKAYDRVDREGLWECLDVWNWWKIVGGGEKFLQG